MLFGASSSLFSSFFFIVFLMFVAAGAPSAQALLLLVVVGPEAQAAGGEAKSAPQIRSKALREARASSLLARNGRSGGHWWRCAFGELLRWI